MGDIKHSEKKLLNDTLMDISALDDCIAWRNNTGSAWQGTRLHVSPGQSVSVVPGMTVLMDSRLINFGLVGSGDILGAWAGKPFSIEMKTLTGQQRVGQQNFERAWKKAGGIYVLARSPEDARRGLFDSILS